MTGVENRLVCYPIPRRTNHGIGAQVNSSMEHRARNSPKDPALSKGQPEPPLPATNHTPALPKAFTRSDILDLPYVLHHVHLLPFRSHLL